MADFSHTEAFSTCTPGVTFKSYNTRKFVISPNIWFFSILLSGWFHTFGSSVMLASS